MKRKDLAYDELEKVIRLKQIGTSWLKIEHETGISRRAAKRAYEKWERSQSPQELKDARKEVAAVELRYHVESLKSLAVFLAINSSVPSSPDMTNAEQFFSQLWSQDILQRFSYTDQPLRLPPLKKWDTQFSFRENELLFQSLQDHIRAEEGRWSALERWKEARNNSAKNLDKLRKESRVVVPNYIKLEQEKDLLRIIEEESRERNPVERMAEAVLNAIWRDILEDKLGQNLVQMMLGSAGSQCMVRVGYETFFLFNAPTDTTLDTTLAQKVTRICNLAITNLGKEDMVKLLQNEVCIMKKASEELREMLNPVKLIPKILRTRCSLCPA